MQQQRAEDNEAKWKREIYGRGLPERYGYVLQKLLMLCFWDSNESHCAYLSTAEFCLEFVQDFLMGLQVITISLMLMILEKLWNDWRRCLNKPMQTGWTVMIREFILVCNLSFVIHSLVPTLCGCFLHCSYMMFFASWVQ